MIGIGGLGRDLELVGVGGVVGDRTPHGVVQEWGLHSGGGSELGLRGEIIGVERIWVEDDVEVEVEAAGRAALLRCATQAEHLHRVHQLG